MLAGDRRWVKSVSTTNLEEFASNRATLTLESLPPQATVSVNARMFSSSLSSIRSLKSSGIHMLTLNDLQSEYPIAIFFRVNTNEPSTICYDEQSSTLKLKTASGDTTKLPISSPREVVSRDYERSSFVAPAEHQWDVLTSYIDDHVLATAGIKSNVAILPSEFAKEDDMSPNFAPLPQPGTTRSMSMTQLTEASFNRSRFIDSLIKRRYSGDSDRLIGEIQFAYVCFAYLGCLKALDHWTLLLKEVCDSYSLDSEFVTKLADVLNMQFAMMSRKAVHLTLNKELRKSLAKFISSYWKDSSVLEFAKALNEIMGYSTPAPSACSDDSD